MYIARLMTREWRKISKDFVSSMGWAKQATTLASLLLLLLLATATFCVYLASL